MHLTLFGVTYIRNRLEELGYSWKALVIKARKRIAVDLDFARLSMQGVFLGIFIKIAMTHPLSRLVGYGHMGNALFPELLKGNIGIGHLVGVLDMLHKGLALGKTKLNPKHIGQATEDLKIAQALAIGLDHLPHSINLVHAIGTTRANIIAL